MADRTRMDKPASLTAAAAGVLLLVVSLPPAIDLFEDTAGSFNISWSSAAFSYDSRGDAGAAGATTTVRFHVENEVTSTIKVIAMPAECRDTFNTQFQQQPATVTWTLKRGTQQIQGGSGSFTCAQLPANGIVFTYNVQPAPDVGSVDAASAEAAVSVANSKASANRETADYVLTFSWARPADGPLGQVPVAPGKSFAATMRLEGSYWKPTASPPEEVPR